MVIIDINKLAEGAATALEAVPELYEDVAQPAAKETGKTVALIPRAINAALLPLQQWILEREYKLSEIEKLLSKKLEQVGEEKIVTPEAYVGVPALQAISYSMDNEELKNLYANLLAKAMNIDTKDFVHPAFVDLIKQMSPIDAVIIKEINQADITPVIHIFKKEPDNVGQHPIITHITWLTNFTGDLISVSLDNLIRLGLIEIPNDIFYTHTENYDRVKNTPYYKLMYTVVKSTLTDGQEIGENNSYIKITQFAKLFYDICIKD